MKMVSQEWLSSVDQDALNKAGFGLVKSRDAYVLHLVQAVARECYRIAKEVETEPTITQVLDHWGAETVAERIRARFGLEDDRG